MNILIADDNKEWCLSLKDGIQREFPYSNISYVYNGKAAIEEITLFQPEILILDIVMPHYDGIYIIRYIREQFTDYNPVIYVLSAMSTETTVMLLNQCKIDYYNIKPISPKTVALNLHFLLNQRRITANEQVHISEKGPVRNLIHEAIHSLGIPMHLVSTKHTIDALFILISDETFLNDITKQLYPAVGKINSCSSVAVERNIRSSCKNMMLSNNEAYQKLFREHGKKSITNKVFLSVLLLHINKKIRR